LGHGIDVDFATHFEEQIICFCKNVFPAYFVGFASGFGLVGINSDLAVQDNDKAFHWYYG
jgi:hypothetical protein